MFQMTLIMRLVRAEMLEVLRTDYIKFARARGLTNRSINFGHALKNTLVPVITIIGLQFGGIVAFSLVTETVFQWPGMGLLLVQSVAVADIPVMSAYLLLIALVFVLINLVVDLLYYAVDPRSGPRLMFGTAWNSDLAYSFRTSPVALLSAAIALILIVAAGFAPWLAPHDPMDVASCR